MDRKQFHHGTHECCPEQWKGTPVITGNFETDASIMASHNADLESRLKLYTNAGIYGQRNDYNAYSGYSGDE
jgi:hypothetical protein